MDFLLGFFIFIIAVFLMRNLYSYFFKASSQSFKNEPFIKPFLQIREGLTLFMLHEFENDISKQDLDITFQNLISAIPIPETSIGLHERLVDKLKNSDEEGSIFAEAIRTKTTALSKLGYFEEGSEIRNNLLSQGFSITERSTSTQPMDFKTLNLKAQEFSEKCRNVYPKSVPIYREYYPA